MIEELQFFGIYVPAALVWAVLAGVLAYWLRDLLQRFGLFRMFWHAGALELALFAMLWWGLSFLADHFLLRALVS